MNQGQGLMMLGVIAILIVVAIIMLFRRNWKWTGISVGLIVLIILAFNIAKKNYCSYDKSVKDVAFPLATIIIKHIEKYGVPENLSDISDIKYELKDCNKTIHSEDRGDYISFEKSETCFFERKDKLYYLKINNAFNDIKSYFYITMYIKQNKTKFKYTIKYNKETQKWDYKDYPYANIYYDYDCWVCDPTIFRPTN